LIKLIVEEAYDSGIRNIAIFTLDLNLIKQLESCYQDLNILVIDPVLYLLGFFSITGESYLSTDMNMAYKEFELDGEIYSNFTIDGIKVVPNGTDFDP
jgi:hypothetical protein